MDNHDLTTLFPGRKVKITDSAEVIVYPMPIKAFRRFKDSCLNLVEKFNQVSKGGWSTILPVLIPIIVDDYLELLNECVEGIDLLDDRCPQHLFPKIAKEWIFESFGDEEKLRPWTDLFEEVLGKLTNEKIDLWQTLSNSLSEVDTTKLTSKSIPSASSKPTFKQRKKPRVRKQS